ncbi:MULTISPECIES: peptidoglycan recognition family protein [unclassified Clostridium]|uniref:peptidoglycan recognition protein family protein n=1 Tax=unclassified Clostridium TaxID=2614128 RepID=UPI000297B262|nr:MULTISPECIES: peptidoglycan recognition family protein [unclassified Clostridium]EKQ51743.1 MAG: negative regulator of beta-lactamase expression [Clostridium sp. Maddingley MBC34-26]
MRTKISYIKEIIFNKKPKIREVKYEWAQPLEHDFKPRMIVYHHTVVINVTPHEIDKTHKKRGWAGIGYHFYIRKNGRIYRGRPENVRGAHAVGVNNRAFGIALEGNFNEEEVTKKQERSLIALSKYLMKKYNITDLKRHKDVSNTECPGKNFPFEVIKEKLRV